MSNYRYSIRTIAVIISIFCGVIIPVRAQNQFGGPQMDGGMSPEKTQALQEEMAEFEKEFASLSPEEQDSFFTSLDDAVKKIDDLSKTEEGKEMLSKLETGAITDEELDSLINQLVEEEPPKKEEPVTEKKEEKKPEAPKQVLTSKHEKAINAINSLIAHTNSFIVKAATVPEFPSKVKDWIKKKQVTLLGGKAWNTVKTDIERLVEQLSRLLERDPKTTEYYHIDALLKNESLLNNIHKIEKNIAEIEPRAEEIPLLGGKRMKLASKKAYHALLNEYNEALYILNSIDELKKLFTLFDPVAKKYREAEEKAVKQAGSKKQVVYTGASEQYTPSSYEDYGDYAPASDYGAASGYTAPSTYIPSAAPRRYSSLATTPAAGKTPQRRAPQKGKSSSLAADEKAKDGEAHKDEKGEEKIQLPKEVIALQEEIDTSVKKIQEKFKEAADLITDNKLVEKIENSFIDASPVDFSVAVELIPDMNKSFNMQKGILGDVHRLHRKLKSVSIRQSVQKKLKRAYDKHKKELDGLYEKLSQLEQNWEEKAKEIPAEKQYAYFGKEDIEVADPEKMENLAPEKLLEIQAQKEQLEQTKSKIAAPYSFFDIKSGLEKVKASIDGFAKAKQDQE